MKFRKFDSSVWYSLCIIGYRGLTAEFRMEKFEMDREQREIFIPTEPCKDIDVTYVLEFGPQLPMIIKKDNHIDIEDTGGMGKMEPPPKEVKHPTTYLETLMHLFKGNVGSGIFAMGDAYKNSGLSIGPPLTVCLGFICVYSQHLLVNASNKMREQLKLDFQPDYAKTVELVFETGSLRMKRYASRIGTLVNLFLCTCQLGFCSVYYVFIATNIKQICDYYGYELDLHYHMAIALVPMLMGSMLRNLKYLAPLSTIANILMTCGIAITIYYATQDLPPLSEVKLVATLQQFPLFFGTTLFAFEGIPLVLPLQSEMRKPKQFGQTYGVLNVGMTLVTILYITVGMLSYIKYGEDIQGSVTLDLPKDEILAQSVKVMLSVGIVLTFPLQFYVPVDILYPMANKNFGPFRFPVITELAFRTFFVLVTFTLAEAVPFLDLFISLVGALCSTTISLIIPAVLDMILYSNISQMTPRIVIKDMLILLLGILGCLTGSYESIRLIAAAFRK